MWNLSKDDNRIAAIDDTGRELTYSELADLANTLKPNANRKLCFNLCRNHLGSLAGYFHA